MVKLEECIYIWVMTNGKKLKGPHSNFAHPDSFGCPANSSFAKVSDRKLAFGSTTSLVCSKNVLDLALIWFTCYLSQSLSDCSA
jgi:hypothetical protein